MASLTRTTIGLNLMLGVLIVQSARNKIGRTYDVIIEDDIDILALS